MYSHEIEWLVKIKQNELTIAEYLNILSSSPQINHVKYENDYYIIETDDKYNFKVKIKTRLQS